MARYLSQYCPSKLATANVPVNYLPQQIQTSGTMLYASEIAGTFTGTLWALIDAGIRYVRVVSFGTKLPVSEFPNLEAELRLLEKRL